MPESSQPLPSVLVAGPKGPRPKPLLLALMVVSLLGSSFALMPVLGAPTEPSRDAVAEQVQSMSRSPEFPAELKEKLTDAILPVMREQVRLEKGFRPYRVGFGIALFAAYTLLLFGTMRAFARHPRAPILIATAAMVLIPVRIAITAVDYALAERLQPVVRQAHDTLVASASPDSIAVPMAQMFQAFSTPILPLLGGLLLCAFFGFTRWYFRRPTVVSFYDA